MKKIVVYLGNINPKKNSSWGIFNVSMKILESLIASDKFEVTLVITDSNNDLFSKVVCKKIYLPERKSTLANKIFLDNYSLNKIIRKLKPTIVLFPRGFIPLKKQKKTTYIPLICDLIPLFYLKRFNPKALLGIFLLIFSMKFSDKIITISEYSKKQISKYSKKQIEVVPLGYDSKVLPTLKTPKGNAVFILANKNPHKNLIKSIELIKRYNSLKKTNFKISYHTGKLTSEELARDYQNAKFSLFLSDIEGFGLPLIESYSYLTPVVFNNKTSLAEIGESLPGKCDVNSEESVFNAIDEVLHLKESKVRILRDALLKRYNWKEFGKKLIEILD